MKENIEHFINIYCSETLDLVGNNEEFVKKEIKKALLKFSFEMCELQKVECLNNAKSYFTYSGFIHSNDDLGYKNVESYIKKESILNCKNVCE